MQTRTTKVFLPQTYEQYLAIKKKSNRHVMSKSTQNNNQHNININNINPNMNNNKQGLSSNRTFSTTTRNVPSNQHNYNNFISTSSNNNNINNNNLLSNDDSDQQHHTNNNTNSLTANKMDSSKNQQKQTKIVQKIVYSQYKTLFQQFQNNKFQQIKKKIQNQLQKLKQKTPLQPLKVNEILKKVQLQSLQNIKSIQQQMQLSSNRRNAQKLDQMLNFNKFFVILNKQKRFRIYQNAKLIKLMPGEIVYRQGQPNQHMYVIIKGCVKQYELKHTSYQNNVQVNFVSYYEGSNFGQAPLINDGSIKGKRYNTTETTQQTYLLQLTNSFYKQLITNSVQDDFQKKIQSLMQTSIFRQTSKMFVTPLLPTLTKHFLPYGTVLIRQGQQVRKLYFVAEGNLQVLLLDRAKRNIKHLNIEQKPKNFYIKKNQTKNTSKQKAIPTKQKSFSIHNTFYYPENTQGNRKQFIYGNKKLLSDEQIQYNDQIVFATLRLGDFIGGKSFLQNIQKQKKMLNSQYFDTSLKAKLSVISSSPKTVVYSIDQKKFFSLSDNFQKLIIQGIMEAKYFDQYNIDEKAQNQKQWKKYSQKLVENVIKAKKNNKSNSFRI